MRLYRTPHGLARGEGDELLVLDLPHRDVRAVLEDDLNVARTARVRTRIAEAGAVLLAPVVSPRKVVIAGANYRDHVKEAGMPMPLAAVFVVAEGAEVDGPQSTIILPAEAPNQVDYEAEVAIVIGLAGQNIPAEQAWDHVGGLTIVNDVSARDVQLAAMTAGVITDTVGVIRGKTFPTFKPMGPCVVTPDEFDRPLDLFIRTSVNGELRQDSRTSEMMFSVTEIIETVSTTVRLEVGDVVLTGTPAGVALATGRYLEDGDLVEIEVESIGQLRNTVVSAP